MGTIELKRCGYTAAFGLRPYDALLNGNRVLQGFKIMLVPSHSLSNDKSYWVVKSWSDCADDFMGEYLAEKRFATRAKLKAYLEKILPEWEEFKKTWWYGA